MYMWMSSLRWKYSSTPTHITGVAQRKRAGLITPRTPDRNGSPVLFIKSHQCSRHLEHPVPDQDPKPRTGVAQRQSVSKHRLLSPWLFSLFCEWLSPYKRKVTGSKPVAGIFLFGCFFRNDPCVIYAHTHTHTHKQTFHRLSSGAERQAHNLEVVGSKPTGGILSFGCFKEATSHSWLTLI